MKYPKKWSVAVAVIASLIFASAAFSQGTTYNWTGTNSNNLNDDGNWAGGSQPAGIGNDQPSTPAIDDTLVFDSDTWVRAPRRLYTRTNRKWGTIQLNNGSIDWANDGNNQGNYSWGGTTTMIVGDGDLTERLENLARKTVNGRIGQPEEIAKAIYFLADNTQSSFMTGQALVVDGGATARLSTE